MSDDPDAPQPQPPARPEIIIDPSTLAGVYANYASVSHSEHEFTLDFVRLDYASMATTPPGRGIVVARVSVSPLFISQLIDALQQNWQNYAKKALPREVYADEPPADDEPGPGSPQA